MRGKPPPGCPPRLALPISLQSPTPLGCCIPVMVARQQTADSAAPTESRKSYLPVGSQWGKAGFFYFSPSSSIS